MIRATAEAALAPVVGPLTGRAVGRFGARPSLVLGGLAMGLSAPMLVDLTPTTSEAWLLSSYLLFGIGFGSINPPITNTAVSGMPPEQAGVASAIASSSRQVGQTLGVAVIGAIAVSTSRGADTLTDASHAGWWLIAGAGAMIVGLVMASTGDWAQGTATRAAARLKAPAG